jgi:hypothetical protein
MLKKTITYTDYNGLERTEDHYFNLNKAEIMKMQVTTAGGLAEMLKRIVAAQDYPAIYNTFENIVDLAYGVKSPDGKRFMKEDENGHKYYVEFKQTEAYSQLIMELATDTKAATDFVNGIVPADANKPIAEAK